MAWWHGVLTKFVWLSVFFSMFSLFGTLGDLHFFFDLFSHFRVQYVVGLALLLLLALPCRMYIAASVLVVLIGIHGVEVARMYGPVEASQSEQAPALRIMTSNLLASNTAYQSKLDFIREINPDVIVLLEYSSGWDSALSGELKAYPHRLTDPAKGVFGIAVYSKFPFLSQQLVSFGYSESPSVDVVVALPSPGNSKEVRIVGTHPFWPIGSRVFAARNTQLQNIARTAAGEPGAMVVAGDLNVSPWSVHYKALLRVGQLRDGRRGFGVLPTWPGSFIPLQIPIDHILVSSEISVVNMQVSESLGSDHLALWADLVIN